MPNKKMQLTKAPRLATPSLVSFAIAALTLGGQSIMCSRLVFVLLPILFSWSAAACIVPPHESFSPEHYWRQDGSAPESPRMVLLGVQRGSSGMNSCSDLAWIKLRVENSNSKGSIGYSFKFLENSTGQDFAPHGYILPKKNKDGESTFRLIWVERPENDGFLPPVKFEIEYMSISENGLESSVSRISVYDRGVPGSRLPIHKPPTSKTPLYDLKYSRGAEK